MHQNIFILLAIILPKILGVATEICDRYERHSEDCHNFDLSKFGLSDPSIFRFRAAGRLGNHLIVYALLMYAKVALGAEAYIEADTKEFLLKVFTEESVRLPVFSETFCNWRDGMLWEVYEGPMGDLLVKEDEFKVGRMILLYDPLQGKTGRGLR